MSLTWGVKGLSGWVCYCGSKEDGYRNKAREENSKGQNIKPRVRNVNFSNESY
jgi:hypothetical protein